MKRVAASLIVGALVLVPMFRDSLAGQTAGLAAGRVSHVGVTVRDIDAALQAYSRVMGFVVPNAHVSSVEAPDGRKVEFKSATLYMQNFHIEVHEPVSNYGPYYDFLQTYGQGIQHVGIAIPGEGSVDDYRQELEKQGGEWTLGTAGRHFAYVDMQKALGTTLEVVRDQPLHPATPVTPAGPLPRLAALKANHVGFAVTDNAVVSRAFATALGITPPTVRDYKDSQYPPGHGWNMGAYLRNASWNQGPLRLELIESVGGPTPWSAFVEIRKGTAVQHLAIDVGVGDQLTQQIRDMQRKGGKWTNGKEGGAYAYLEFMDTLGLIFELNAR
ncbi:MAG: VOC family protein [Vicinamibacterales bacterium]